MLATKVNCPHCSCSLHSSKGIPTGQTIRCTRCGNPFTVPDNCAAAKPETIRANPPSQDHGPLLTPLPQQPLPRPTSLGGAKGLLILGGILGVLFCLGVATALAVLLAMRLGPAPSPEGEPGAGTTEAPSPPPAPGGEPAPSPPHPSPVPPPEPWLPPEKQQAVDQAIDKGVAYLKKLQRPEGNWPPTHNILNAYPVGSNALPALTLLKCGVPASDPHVQKAAAYLRQHIPRLSKTYSIALAILFFEALGDPADDVHLRTLAMRLVAGQQNSGGWTYTCPLLDDQQALDLSIVLEQRLPDSPLDLFVRGPDGQPPGWVVSEAEDFEAPSKTTGNPPPARSVFVGQPGEPDSLRRRDAKEALASLPKAITQKPALKSPRESQQLPPRSSGTSDNSNTQFATLGLWAARRQGLPVDRALALVAQRFRTSQSKKGGWDYHYRYGGAGQTPSMTGAGLLGLAVGHGLVSPRQQARQRKDPPHDQAVERGLAVLSEMIGKLVPGNRPRNHPGNLYFMWTVERVGMLFGLRQINGKDWYEWGSTLLVKHQDKKGNWNLGGYPGSADLTDTSFALLFLSRSNLATDLSKSLEYLTVGKQRR
jgi:hypothetical protein